MRELVLDEEKPFLQNYKRMKQYNSVYKYDEGWIELSCTFFVCRIFFKEENKYNKKLMSLVNNDVDNEVINDFIMSVAIENLESQEVVKFLNKRLYQEYNTGFKDGKLKTQEAIRKVIGL